MGLNLLFLVAELWLLSSGTLILHRLSPRLGLAPLLILLGGLAGLLQFSSPLSVFVRPFPSLTFPFGSTVLVPVLLLGVLTLYAANGARPARLAIVGILGVEALALMGLIAHTIHLQLPGGGNFAGLSDVGPVVMPNPRTTAASMLAFVVDLAAIAAVYQAAVNRRAPVWLAAGLALLVSLWADALVFPTLNLAGRPDLLARLPGQIVGKTLAALLVWPLAAFYLARVASRLPGFAGTAPRSVLELLFGMAGRAEIALTHTEARLAQSLARAERSECTLLALSRAAQAVQQAMTPEEVYRALGDEVVKLGYHAVVYRLSDDASSRIDRDGARPSKRCDDASDAVHLIITYWTFPANLVRQAEKLVGLSAKDYRFPVEAGTPYYTAAVERQVIFSRAEYVLEAMATALPQPLRPLAGRLVAVLGIGAGILTPMMAGERVIGVLAITGADLSEADIPAMSAFANQAAIALEKARLFEETRHHAEQLRKLSRAVEQSSAAIVISDTAGNIEYVNPKFTQLSGYTAEEVIGRNPRILKSGETPPEEYKKLWETITAGHEWRGEFHNKKKNGELYWVSTLISPVVDETGRITHFLGIQEDITARKQAEEELARRARYAALLNDITMAANSAPDFKTMLQTFADRLGELFDANGAFITLWDETQQRTVPAAAYGHLRDVYPTYVPEPGEVTMTASVLTAGHPLVAEDVFDTPYLSPRIAALCPTRSMLALPLIAGEQKLGAALISFEQPHHFIADEIARGEQAAGQIALAVAKARLFESERQHAARQRALAETAGSLLTVRSLEDLWPAIVAAVRQTLYADRAAIYLYDRAADRMSCPYVAGLSAEYVAEINRCFHEVPGSRILKDPSVVTIADAQADPATASIRDLVVREGFHSYAVFPLVAPGDILGAFVAYRDEVAPFSSDDITVGQTLAHIVSTALQNARLFEETHRRLKQQQAIYQLTSLLMRVESLDEIYAAAMTTLHHLLGAERASILLFDPDGVIRFKAWHGLSEAYRQAVTGHSPWPRDAVNPQPVTVADVMEAPELEALRTVILNEGIRALGFIPIVHQGRLLGKFMVYYDAPHTFSAEEIQLAQTIAHHIAVALARQRAAEELARLNAELDWRARQLATLHETALDITARRDMTELLEAITARAAGLLGVASSSLSLVDHDGETLTMVAVHGLGQEFIGTRLRRGEAMGGRVLESGQPLVVEDYNHWEGRASVYSTGVFGSVVSVPLLVAGQVIGVLCCYEVPGVSRTFDDADVELLESLAQQAAIAIQNARLYEQVQRHTAELEQRVAERTAELRERVGEVEQLNHAMLNLLEDLLAARHHAEETARQLAEANRELEAFTYSVSHDLRAPLRAMDGFSRILLEEYAAYLPVDAQRYLRLVRENAQQMGALIQGLLTLSRVGRQSLARQTVAPAEIVQQVLAELEAERKGRNVEIVIGELPPCEADPVLLKRVWVNLLANALKFTRRRDAARIEIGSIDPKGLERPLGSGPIYFVRDNGAGFDMQYAHKLFGVFQRLHRAEEYEGSGVGLAIVQRIVHRHGGRIWAEAEVDKGATFYFTLASISEEPGRGT